MHIIHKWMMRRGDKVENLFLILEKYGIITAKRLLYLRIPVSAFTAEIRALKSAGGCHGPKGHGIITAKRLLYLRIPVSAFTAEIRALNSAGGSAPKEKEKSSGRHESKRNSAMLFIEG